MKGSIYYFLVLLFFTYSCKPAQESDLNLKHLDNIADNINADLKSIKDEIINLTIEVQYKVNFEENTTLKLDDKYHFHKNEILFVSYDENHSAVYYPAENGISDDIKKIIINSEKLDSFFIESIRKNPILSQVYFLDTNSFLRIYPYIDVISYLKNSVDLTKLISFQSVKFKPLISENAYWINQPFADPYGRGWIISCVEPLYFRDRFLGIISGDVPLRTIKTKYFSSNDQMILMTNSEGKIICCTKESTKVTNIPQYRDFQYYKPVVDDVYIFNNCSLLEHKNKNFRNAFKALLDGHVKEEFTIDSKKYTIYKSQIRETNWYLFKIIN